MQRQILTLFCRQAWQYPRYVIGILLILPITILTHQFLPPLVLAGMVQQLATGHYVQGDLWGSFGAGLALFIFLRFTSATIIWRAVIVLLWKLESNVVRDLNQRVFDHLIQQSGRFHANHFGGSLVASTNRFTNAYSRLAESLVMQFIPLILSFLFTGIILLPRAPHYIAFLLAITAIYIVIVIFGTREVRQTSSEHASAQSRQTGELADALTNVMAVKSFAAEGTERRRFASALHKSQQKFFAMMHTTHSRELSFSSITATITSVSMVLAFASVVLFNADIAVTFLIIEYTTTLTARLWEFTTGTLRTYNRSIGEATDMTQLLEQKPDVQDPVAPQPVRIRKGAVSLQNVTFTHADADDAIFRELSLAVAPGEKVGLVGLSGAGKTTLVKLLLRFADIDSGTITIDGQSIAAISQHDLRSHIAYVPQEPLLFHRTIRENIAYGNPATTNRMIEKAASQAHAADFIKHLPQGYDTLVGERGVKLSGGQRQRIAIARAMLKNAPILVLDEATSALDSESEKAIQASLASLMKHRTTIAIAHRLSTIQKMDRIIVLDKGQIAEQGTHTQLLAANGIYAQLWAHQSGGFIED